MQAAPSTERILVVDDEPEIVALVTYHLAKVGYRVATAATGREALDLARRERPSLIVLAGNAGDGKSHLLNRVYRHRLTDPTLQRMEVIVDATHALHHHPQPQHHEI